MACIPEDEDQQHGFHSFDMIAFLFLRSRLIENNFQFR